MILDQYRKRIVFFSSLLIGGLLLTGCSNNAAPADGQETKNESPDSSTESAVYDFENLKVADTDDALPLVASNVPVTIKLAPDLMHVIPNGKKLAVESFNVSAKAFDTGYCRVDVQIAYANGDIETLRAAEATERKEKIDQAKVDLEKAIIKASKDIGYSVEETKEKFLSGPNKEQNYRMLGFSESSFVYKEPTILDVFPIYARDAKIVETLPNDDSLEQSNLYVTNDGTGFTKATECSSSDSDELVELEFTYTEGNDSKQDKDNFASAKVAVVQGADGVPSGSTMSVTGSVDAKVGVTGNWTAKD